jgi:DNA polymerase-3 subunit delta'
MDLKEAEGYPWLAPARAQVKSAVERGRLPHAVLVHARPGLGGESLALWIAGVVLCEVPAAAPCGQCASCRLLAAGNHPDLAWVTRAEDAKSLQIEQIRTVCDVLALKSYRGGYKVAVIATADVMTANAANALLKTLEEPPPQTLLVLCSARPSRLPATIVSRCQRVPVATPARTVALDWLQQQDQGAAWNDVLDFASGAPLRALELRANAFDDLHREMTQALTQLARRELDIPGVAERWSRNALETRLEWMETWVTNSIRQALLEAADLQTSGGIRKIRGLYGVLDRAREMRLELASSLNVQLAAEELLLRAESALAA